MNWHKELIRIVKGKVKFNEPLFKHTTLRVGGCADVWFEPKDLLDLARVLKLSREKKIPIFIIGAGSNLLISDNGIKGIVLKLASPFFATIKFKENYAFVGAGLNLNKLVNLAKENNLSGCEFLAGIPGTLGGALVMNAGVKDIFSKNGRYFSIADLLKEVKVLGLDGKLKTLKKRDIRFGYRSSSLSKFIIICAKLELKPMSKETISSLTRKFISYKSKIQDLKSPSAGCVFKNPINSFKETNSAGKMIDASGLKGKEIGGACVSKIHANFILNKHRAKAKDILKLMHLIKNRVKQRFNVSLVPEIKIVGKF
ncbi:MAG: UDP-N-acetylmuramate dehydrogenase [Candidatus Omnitrophota bacterium]|nr:UDP-N-acetylmuramate dehydrogenase [Candidatus Omnitrophota bacterium]